MTERRMLPARVQADDASADTSAAADAGLSRHRHKPLSTLTGRVRAPRTHEDVERDYEAARNAWTAAMGAARSGRPADLAALAVAQEAYESALAEKHRWDASPRATTPVESERPKSINAVVAQELARRRAQELDEEHRRQKPKGLSGLVNRLRGR